MKRPPNPSDYVQTTIVQSPFVTSTSHFIEFFDHCRFQEEVAAYYRKHCPFKRVVLSFENYQMGRDYPRKDDYAMIIFVESPFLDHRNQKVSTVKLVVYDDYSHDLDVASFLAEQSEKITKFKEELKSEFTNLLDESQFEKVWTENYQPHSCLSSSVGLDTALMYFSMVQAIPKSKAVKHNLSSFSSFFKSFFKKWF